LTTPALRLGPAARNWLEGVMFELPQPAYVTKGGDSKAANSNS
jgi:hypothetical protein